MKIEDIHDLIEKAILSGRQLKIDYTNAEGRSDVYRILAITSTWKSSFITVAESDSRGRSRPFNKFRYDRISAVDITEEYFQPNDHLVEKIRDGSLFSDSDNRIYRRGGLKGYPSSINYIAESRPKLTKSEAESLIRAIDLPLREGWSRAVILDVVDGDSCELLLESDSIGSYVTRLFGVDAPECREGAEEFVLGLEAKIFVEDLFKSSRYCYVKSEGTDSFKRNLMQILNAEGKNVAIELLRNGLAIPMMSYFQDVSMRNEYETETNKAYENKTGLWSIESINEVYNNIISDSVRTEINLLSYVPEKKSAFSKYVQKTPKAKIIRAAVDRKNRSKENKKRAKIIFEKITSSVRGSAYDLESFKRMSELYLEEIEEVEKTSDNSETVKDCIMHLEDMVDDLNLGEGEIKGNFSKGVTKLIYHDDPEDRWYKLCIPEIRFKTAKDARYCGFRKRK